MPDIATVLKEEISRLARKEQKAESDRQKKAAAQSRSEITALKRRLVDLERIVSTLTKKVTGKAPAEAVGLKKQVRFSPQRLQAWRKKVKLSAAELAQLVGVSAQTVYHWEAGKARPKPSQLAQLAELRTGGKRKLAVRLSSVGGAEPTPQAGTETAGTP